MSKSCSELQIPFEVVFSKSRKQEYVYIRNSFAYILINVYNLSQINTCEYLGWHRSNVSTACKTAKEDMKSKNNHFIETYNVCYNQLFKTIE